MTGKSVFREAYSPEMTSQSFPCPVFGLTVLYPTESAISRFWYVKTRQENRYWIICFAILIRT